VTHINVPFCSRRRLASCATANFTNHVALRIVASSSCTYARSTCDVNLTCYRFYTQRLLVIYTVRRYVPPAVVPASLRLQCYRLEVRTNRGVRHTALRASYFKWEKRLGNVWSGDLEQRCVLQTEVQRY
jgi:hypothetical protein